MPTVWGKSREDRQGGLAAVFARGEQLAAIWANDPVAAEQNGIAKVGLSAPTYNRHINTLKQLFTFAGGLEDGDGRPTHLAPKPSFQKLHQKDKRKKNMRKPTPAHDEVRTLVSGPIYKGSASLTDRFVPGDLVFHDGAYWVPLLIILYGARSNEFCQMPLANVITDAETPFFRICETTHQSIKTSSSGRELPIAPKLIELGFIDYVRALREQREFRLFPEFNRTNVPARKVFRDTVFVPLREHHFPNGTSNILDGKEIDTQSFRKFAATHLRKAEPKISRSIRQAFFGHQLGTTLEDTYEDSFTPDELLPCVERMQTLIDHVEKFPLRLRPDAEA